MESGNVPFNYFYNIFQNEFRRLSLEKERMRIGNTADQLSDIFDFYTSLAMSKEEKISIYNQILYDICINYVSISNSSIYVFPKEPLELIDLILNKIHENPYRESFLMSLQFIYQDYFNCLGKGSPTLMSSNDSSENQSFQITLDYCNKISEFDSTNMDLVEQDKTMNKILFMELNNQVGPIPKVLYRIRKY